MSILLKHFADIENDTKAALVDILNFGKSWEDRINRSSKVLARAGTDDMIEFEKMLEDMRKYVKLSSSNRVIQAIDDMENLASVAKCRLRKMKSVSVMDNLPKIIQINEDLNKYRLRLKMLV